MDHITPSPDATAETAGVTKTMDDEGDDALLLEDLEAIAARTLSRLAPVEDRFETLYRVEPVHLFTATPLVAPQRARMSVPVHILAAGALLIFLAATAAPDALSGFDKAPVTPSVTGVIEPFKPFPGLEIELPATVPPAAAPAADEGGSIAADGPAPARPARDAARASSPRRSATTATTTTRPADSAAAPRAAAGSVGAAVDQALGLDDVLAPALASADLPRSPTRAEVTSALRGVSAAVARCGEPGDGRVSVDVTVNGPTGRVSTVRVGGADAETGACVDRAVRGARFPRFSDPSFTVRGFPFGLD
jgi:hypothetical protein